MSDNFIMLIPEDPRAVPSQACQQEALARLAEIAPDADERELVLLEHVAFFDCGGNFERVLCPLCKSDLTEWWSDRMSEDYAEGEFLLRTYPTPCCQDSIQLNDLVYEWPQGFARFALSIRNAGFGELELRHVRELSAILGLPLRLIYQHI
jgi:hypothetical protein